MKYTNLTELVISYEEYEAQRQRGLREAAMRSNERERQGLCAFCNKPHNGRRINGGYYCRKHYPTRNS
jgi:hypothetical protein